MTNELLGIITVVLILVIAGGLIMFDEWRNRGHRLELVEEQVEELKDKVDELSTY